MKVNEVVIVVVILAGSAAPPEAKAQTTLTTSAQVRDTATVITDAPIFLLPDATRQPLRIARKDRA